MKKWGILIGGLIFGFVFGTKAQTDIESLFSANNENIIYENEAKNYTGSPLVFIEGISDKPRPKTWNDKLKIKLFGSMNGPEKIIQKPLAPLDSQENNVQKSLKITSFFGQEKDIIFTPHTSDWNFIIHILNDEDIVIQEDIQFVKTDEIDSPVRDWAQKNLTLLDVSINGQKVPLQLTKEDNISRLKLPVLETGVHRIHLSYLVKNAGIFSKNSADISLNLMDVGWNLPTSSMTGVVLFSKDIREATATFLFGKNYQEVQNAFEIKKDRSGELFFRATHLLPAFSAIQLNLNLKFDSFIQRTFLNKVGSSAPFLIFIISLCIILGYLILNIVEIRMVPVEEAVFHKKFRFSNNSLLSFFYRTGEIWVGLILLWGITFIAFWMTHNSPSFVETQLLFLLPIVFVLITDYLLLYPRQESIKKMKGIK